MILRLASGRQVLSVISNNPVFFMWSLNMWFLETSSVVSMPLLVNMPIAEIVKSFNFDSSVLSLQILLGFGISCAVVLLFLLLFLSFASLPASVLFCYPL